MMTAAATIAIIPFSDVVDIFGTPTGLYGVDPSIGILFAFAFGGIAFYGADARRLGLGLEVLASSARCAPPPS